MASNRGGIATLWQGWQGWRVIFSSFFHRILPIVSPVSEIFKTLGMAIAVLVSPPLAFKHEW